VYKTDGLRLYKTDGLRVYKTDGLRVYNTDGLRRGGYYRYRTQNQIILN